MGWSSKAAQIYSETQNNFRNICYSKEAGKAQHDKRNALILEGMC